MHSLLMHAGLQAAADEAWPLMFEFIAKTRSDARFVIWLRDANDWARSAWNFFTAPNTWSRGGAYANRFFLLSYGSCRIADSNPKTLAKVYRAHTKAVLEYFHGPTASVALRNRLLVLDFTEQLAGRKLCQFALGNHADCSKHTALPFVPANRSSHEWFEWAIAAGGDATLRAWTRTQKQAHVSGSSQCSCCASVAE